MTGAPNKAPIDAPGAGGHATAGITVEAVRFSAGEPRRQNPFHPAGTLPAGHSTYVARACDAELITAFHEKPLIAIAGEISTGKSSLVIRALADLTANCDSCYMDLQDVRADNEAIFTDDFFERISNAFGRKINNWQGLRNAERRVVVFIDELGFLGPAVAQNFIPRLVTHATKPDVDIRIIVCFPLRHPDGAIQSLLYELGVKNEKYGRVWHNIRIPPLDRIGINQLVSLLSHRAQTIAHTHSDIIGRLSEGYPMRVQRLCNALWEAEANGESDAELEKIVRTKRKYED